MYLRDVWRSCLRRWWLLLLCLVVSGGLWYVAFGLVKPTYESEASVVLVPPVSTEDPSQNRYLGLGGLKQSADVLSRSIQSADVAEKIQDAVPGAEYLVEADFTTSAPILVVTATADTPGGAAGMLSTVLKRLPGTLRHLQEEVDIAENRQITMVMVSQDSAPDTVETTRLRVLGMLAAGLLALSLLTVAAVDGLLLRRASRRPDGDPSAASDPTADQTADEPADSPSDSLPDSVSEDGLAAVDQAADETTDSPSDSLPDSDSEDGRATVDQTADLTADETTDSPSDSLPESDSEDPGAAEDGRADADPATAPAAVDSVVSPNRARGGRRAARARPDPDVDDESPEQLLDDLEAELAGGHRRRGE
ncbi:hypothetical protein [Nocardioides insulae]|uniref:hypothetical protein n=1 Tax=Nocardioides insulae TaxID=394734 RepID=UPI00041C84E9|nr:hypothetical protein [Nocardioides insulae]